MPRSFSSEAMLTRGNLMMTRRFKTKTTWSPKLTDQTDLCQILCQFQRCERRRSFFSRDAQKTLGKPLDIESASAAPVPIPVQKRMLRSRASLVHGLSDHQG